MLLWDPFRGSLAALAAHFEHALHRFQSLEAQRFVHIDRRREGLQAGLQFLQGVKPHVGAGIAAATIQSRNVEQGFLWNPLLHLMQDPRFRQNDEAVAGALFGVIQELAGGSNEIRQVQQVLLAFGVGDHFSSGMFVLESQHGFFAEGLVNDAASRPEGQLATALLLHPAPEVLIGGEQHRLI